MKKKRVFKIVSCLVLISLQYLMVEISVFSFSDLMGRKLFYNIAGLSTIYVFLCVLNFFIKKTSKLFAISSTFLFFFSIANHYTHLLHGNVLTFQEIRELSTAINVISRYSFNLTNKTIMIICLYISCLLLSLIYKREGNSEKNIYYLVIACAISIVSIITIKPAGFYYEDAYKENGIINSFIKSCIDSVNSFSKPNNITDDRINKIKLESKNYNSTSIQSSYPDIILILNESFYDPSIYIQLDTNQDYLYNINNLDNVIKGYALNYGLGTNCTEYELLTSNYMKLINGGAPFTFLNLKNCNNIAKYLNDIGYETYGMHFLSKNNYNRDYGYKELGFNNYLFDDDINMWYTHYGNRYHTDSEDFYHMREQYFSTENYPKLMYLLTYQNHGGYEINDETFDVVKVANDLGEYTDDMDEFLTSIKMTDDAFKELTDFYKTIDREVIILMVGDHAPSFISNLDCDFESTILKDIALHSTPYIIWSNKINLKDVNGVLENNYSNIFALVPSLLKICNMPLSYYYNKIIELDSSTPCIIHDYFYKNNHVYQLNTLNEEILDDYLTMEYLNLTEDQTYKECFTLNDRILEENNE